MLSDLKCTFMCIVFQPIQEIMSQIRGLERNPDQEVPRILLHTDAAQTIGKMPVDVNDLQVDYLTVVGHKVILYLPTLFSFMSVNMNS